MGKFINKAYRETVSQLSKLCLKSTVVHYLGSKFKIPLVHGVGAGYHVIEKDLMDTCLETCLGLKDGAVIDIGTNIGLYLIKLRSLDRTREYYGFEPNPLCDYFVQEIIRLNSFENTKIFSIALSDTVGLTRFHAGKKADKMGSVKEFPRSGGKRSMEFSFDLITRPGDDIIDMLAIDRIGLVKVDVEGAELNVLQGIRKTIEKYRPFLYCEIWPMQDQDSRFLQEIIDSRKGILRLMEELDYHILGFKEDGSTISINSHDEFNDASYNDFLFIHDHDLDAIKTRLLNS